MAGRGSNTLRWTAVWNSPFAALCYLRPLRPLRLTRRRERRILESMNGSDDIVRRHPVVTAPVILLAGSLVLAAELAVVAILAAGAVALLSYERASKLLRG